MHQQTRRIIDYFEQISRIPRCSKNEMQIARWLRQWAEKKGWAVQSDAAGNLVIKVPASQGAEQAPPVILQGHMDMVCEKRGGSGHDFSKDPIRLVEDGLWLTAAETTLGADNGIAIALALALVDTPAIEHPPLELFFTVDEETGLNGALQMDPTMLSGKILINLDSEEEGLFVVGCAGGRDTTLRRPSRFTALTLQQDGLAISAQGMRGGHSGIDIAKHRANANTVMARLLDAARAQGPIQIVDILGGTGRNVIPRSCEVRLACPSGRIAAVEQAVRRAAETIRAEFSMTDPGLTIRVERWRNADTGCRAMTEADSSAAIDLLLALPSGPIEMSAEFPLLVQTSTNLSMVAMEADGLWVITSQRSSVLSRLDAICRQVAAIGNLAGARVASDAGYPPWPMNPDSALLERCKTLYRELFGSAADVQVIHAGLECGVIGDHCPEMDMISLGPTIENPHSPSERLHLPSVEKVWQLLVALMASFGKRS
ncbi:Aminoacyl-histidine dipeptidase [Desulfosarcina cetonica]|uniref:aminoacyl-histidine dipeptidase n=1 Tax=Desulfosarcina cetonica TaxID=90730 RepID=UPI0006D101BF|nr:aminoacyl-histidine dipeptidase [Desulfosarcina cetonica]VTR64292.1 Aminoacyl-histidine dipeptidase [Desulfosarcina cetonica]